MMTEILDLTSYVTLTEGQGYLNLFQIVDCSHVFLILRLKEIDSQASQSNQMFNICLTKSTE